MDKYTFGSYGSVSLLWLPWNPKFNEAHEISLQSLGETNNPLIVKGEMSVQIFTAQPIASSNCFFPFLFLFYPYFLYVPLCLLVLTIVHILVFHPPELQVAPKLWSRLDICMPLVLPTKGYLRLRSWYHLRMFPDVSFHPAIVETNADQIITLRLYYIHK